MDRSLPADAAPFPLASTMVEGCLDLDQLADQVFARAWRGSLAALSPAERRGALAGVTGHVAESVVELLLCVTVPEVPWLRFACSLWLTTTPPGVRSEIWTSVTMV